MKVMPEDHQAVWIALQQHIGRDNGIPFADLATLCDLPERQLRKVVAGLVTKYRKDIGTHPRFGYFICKDRKDYQIARGCLYGHFESTLDRYKILGELQEEFEERTRAPQPTTQANLFERVGV